MKKLTIDGVEVELSDESYEALRAHFVPEAEQAAWPQEGDEYWYVDSDGEAMITHWKHDELDNDRRDMNNIFLTEDEAIAHMMRLKSMKKTFLPQDGETYFFIISTLVNESGWGIQRLTWTDHPTDWDYYHSGRVFQTEDEAALWGGQFGKYWFHETPEAES